MLQPDCLRPVLSWQIRLPYMARYPDTDTHRAEERAERRRFLIRQVDQRPVPFADTSPVGMIEPRVALGKFEALQQVWPYVQSRDLEGLATAFPTSSAKFLDREARSAVMTWHISGMSAAQLHDAIGLEPEPGQPCSVDFDLDLPADQVGDFLDWHGQTGRPSQQQLAIEWARHWS